MASIRCGTCKKEVERITAREIGGRIYCIECAERSTHLLDEIKDEIQKEKDDIVKERDAIEKRLELISEDETNHIIVTTTDTIEGRPIIDYVDIVSVQDIISESTSFDPALVEAHNDVAERVFRNRIESNLFKLKKRAYLTGADAIVGLLIDSSMDHQRKGEYMAAVSLKISITGTAVRLADRD